LGNHDYAEYIGGDDAVEKVANCRETQSLERQMGWTLLMNEHRVVRRGKDYIVVAGMENDGDGRFPQLGNVAKTLSGKDVDWDKSPFIVMLEHDPSSWRRKILPESTAQLTLSGHTHGGQFSLFGWSPVALSYRDWHGMSYEGTRALYVSSGAGSLIPFRLNQPREIVVITLRKK
jgi:predicted MPP superfamily phosphohydrolase